MLESLDVKLATKLIFPAPPQKSQSYIVYTQCKLKNQNICYCLELEINLPYGHYNLLTFDHSWESTNGKYLENSMRSASEMHTLVLKQMFDWKQLLLMKREMIG